MPRTRKLGMFWPMNRNWIALAYIALSAPAWADSSTNLLRPRDGYTEWNFEAYGYGASASVSLYDQKTKKAAGLRIECNEDGRIKFMLFGDKRTFSPLSGKSSVLIGVVGKSVQIPSLMLYKSGLEIDEKAASATELLELLKTIAESDHPVVLLIGDGDKSIGIETADRASISHLVSKRKAIGQLYSLCRQWV